MPNPAINRRVIFPGGSGVVAPSILGPGATLFFDYRSATTGSIVSVTSTGSNPLELTQATPANQPTGGTAYPLTLGNDLITNGGFDTDTGWTKDPNWAIAAGVATHTPSGADSITQAIAIGSSQIFLKYTLSGRTAGSVLPQLIGDTTQNGTSNNVNGVKTEFITGDAATALGMYGTPAFDGSLDDIKAKIVTSTGPGAYFDSGDYMMSSAITNADIGLTGSGDIVCLAVDFFMSEYMTYDSILGKGETIGSVAATCFGLGVGGYNKPRVMFSDGTTQVIKDGSTPLDYGRNKLIAVINLAANTCQLYVNDPDTPVVNSTASGLTSFNDVGRIQLSSSYGSQRDPLYMRFADILVGREYTAAERTEIMAA